MRFGLPAARPVPAGGVPAAPDVVIAYDVWAFWLTVFAGDVSELWKEAGADRSGLDEAIARHGLLYCPGRGTLFAALPLLRSPMGLFASREVALKVLDPAVARPNWTWDSLTAAMDAAALGIGTSDFSVDTGDGAYTVGQREIAAEAAAALIASYGGALTNSTLTTAPGSQFGPETLAALKALAAFRAAGHLPVSDQNFLHPYIAPAYLWEPVGGGALSVYARPDYGGGGRVGGVFYPWPGGPRRRAVPASYLCAYVWKGSARWEQAGDFCTFLLSSNAKRLLLRVGGGFALRSSDAVAQLPYAGTHVARPGDVVASGYDLSLEDLYGRWKTDENAPKVDHVADEFVAMLRRGAR